MRLQLLLILIIISGCTHRSQESDYKENLSKIIEMCTEYQLPNPMARSEGFDLHNHLTTLHENMLNLEKIFYNNEGIMFLKSQLETANEDTAICIKETLARAQEANKVINYAPSAPDAATQRRL